MNASTSIAANRQHLGLTQLQFGMLLGFSVSTVNLWENAKVAPSGLSLAVLTMLDSVGATHGPEVILSALRACNGEPLAVIRALSRLEIAGQLVASAAA
ncbi:helix-turn-helix domain-containing protein [Chondromyces apiculatus]|uniref:HTH cro/C1-type domain-containing protein n=1 Tax=Chondromyces apiculatus DSM 436 TaxID=1192034 RepID=A0A017TES5_9BACT|nr:helix-turn-helix domain-containing protein [Chondromyces apiculatus]EYF07066.1 Hypothetical protein CAP_1325 [Chondromyces apiculatus DSM 436]